MEKETLTIEELVLAIERAEDRLQRHFDLARELISFAVKNMNKKCDESTIRLIKICAGSAERNLEHAEQRHQDLLKRRQNLLNEQKES